MTRTTISATQPSNWLFGDVITVSPLSIQIEQRDILPENFFFLTNAVKDHWVDIQVNHVSEKRAGGSGEPAYASHDHDYIGRKKIMIYNGLKVGERVILIQKAGGQEYIVLDRVTPHIVIGQWLS